MGLETGNYLSDLVITNPTGTDPKGQGDDHLRLIKKVLRDSFTGFSGAVLVTGTDTGTANTYVLTPSPALPSYVNGMVVLFIPTNDSTGAATINVSGLGAIALKSVSGAALINGEIATGSPVLARYNGTDFRLTSITKQYADQLAFGGSLPGLGGAEGKALFVVAGIAAWQFVFPTETGNAGKALKTNGTTESWDWDGYQGRVSKSANYPVVLTDRYTIIDCSATLTLTMTAAATLGSKFIIRVPNSSSTGIVTVDPNASETINGAATLSIGPGETWDIVCDGSSFYAYCVVQAGNGPQVIIQEQAASGSGSATSTTATAYNTRDLNTVVRNTAGASLASKQVTLPAGTWELSAWATVNGAIGTRIRIRNVSDSTNAALGAALVGGDYGGVTTAGAIPMACGVVTIASAKTFEVQHFISSNTASGFTMGFPLASGDANVFAEFRATRISA